MEPGFPSSFVSRIRFQLGTESAAFLDALKKEAVVAVRLNPAKPKSIGDEIVPWCTNGRYLNSRPSFTLDPLFHAGVYYVQDASSMFLEQVFLQLKLNQKDLLILDACAAPGGKSTHLSSLMSPDSFLVSNEVIASRLPSLRENTMKWGFPNVMITNADPSAFTALENRFDVILIDAPCSGEGLFRKDPEAMEEWSDSSCELNAARQQRIHASLIPALKEEGILIYSTCTFNPGENEKMVSWLVKNHDMECIALNVPDDWGIKKINEGLCTGYAFYPHRLKGEGLFISVLKKKTASGKASPKRAKSKRFLPAGKKLEELKSWIASEKYSLVKKDNLVFAFHDLWQEEIEFLSSHLKTLFHGGCIAEMKGDKAIPAHELAMSILLNKDAFPQIDLNLSDALHYLRKENFVMEKAKNGFTLVTFKNTPLGFVNFFGSRFNNYYPVNWRIRQQDEGRSAGKKN